MTRVGLRARAISFARLVWLCAPWRRFRSNEEIDEWVRWVLEPLERRR